MHHVGAFSPENSQNSVTNQSQAVTNRYTLLQSVSSSTRPDSVRVRHFEEVLMEISCRSPQQIDEDFMISELEGLKKALSKWYVGFAGMPGEYYLRGAERKRALGVVAAIEAAILEGETLDSSRLARQTWNIPH